MTPIEKEGCDQMAKLGTNFISFINNPPRTQQFINNNWVRLIRISNESRRLSSTLFIPRVKVLFKEPETFQKDMLDIIKKDVDMEKLQYEWMTILGGKMEAKPK